MSSRPPRACVNALQQLRFTGQDAATDGVLFRFVRDTDKAVIDLLAPDHAPPRRSLTTRPQRRTISIDGGYQALQRAVLMSVATSSRSVLLPVPTVLGALILKAAAARGDNRDP
jgi:hypothetical protein